LIKEEEDVLHVAHLPTFNNSISKRHSELLISYLTAPYLRIPLLLAFFAQPDSIGALADAKLQTVLDCAMFEPFYWLPSGTDLDTTKIPFVNRRKKLATPLGLLFHELQHSPEGLLTSLTDLLDICMDLGTNTYAPSTSTVILFVTRLVVRVEEFIIYLVEHDKWLKKGASVCNNGYETHVRGLETGEETLRLLETAQQSMRNVLGTRVLGMLEKWCAAATYCGELGLACKLHAHLAYLYKNVTEEQLDIRVVSVLLSSQIFLTGRHDFFANDTPLRPGDFEFGKRATGLATTDIDPEEQELGLADTELFDLFQKHRLKVYKWLQSHPDDANEVFEAVVRIATFTVHPPCLLSLSLHLCIPFFACPVFLHFRSPLEPLLNPQAMYFYFASSHAVGAPLPSGWRPREPQMAGSTLPALRGEICTGHGRGGAAGTPRN
jgi:hypothetical protein